VHFHFTPTSFDGLTRPHRGHGPVSPWLNQVEIWFSILAGKALEGASFNSLQQLWDHIDHFIETYNETAHPFAWTKSKVHQKRLKPRFADQ